MQVGQFSLDADGMLSGPADYMQAQGNTLLDQILAGEDSIFNMTAHQSPSLEVAVLVRMQTDYAGWKGVQELLPHF